MILFSLHAHIEGKIPLRQGEKNNIRLIDIPLLAITVGKSICTARGFMLAQDVILSVLCWSGKIKGLHLIRVSNEFREAFEAIGTRMAYI